MTVGDTTPEAAGLQRAVIERMAPEARLRVAFDMSDLARRLALIGLRQRHPQASETELRRRLVALAFLPAQPPAPFREAARRLAGEAPSRHPSRRPSRHSRS
jgi:hypothetical protein